MLSEDILRIKNTSGIAAAFNVSVEISSSDKEVTGDKYLRFKKLIDTLHESTFSLEPLGVRDYELIETVWSEQAYKGCLDVCIKYNDIYTETFSLRLSEFTILGDSITNENAIAKEVGKLAGILDGIESKMRRL